MLQNLKDALTVKVPTKTDDRLRDFKEEQHESTAPDFKKPIR